MNHNHAFATTRLFVKLILRITTFYWEAGALYLPLWGFFPQRPAPFMPNFDPTDTGVLFVENWIDFFVIVYT